MAGRTRHVVAARRLLDGLLAARAGPRELRDVRRRRPLLGPPPALVLPARLARVGVAVHVAVGVPARSAHERVGAELARALGVPVFQLG